MTIKFGLTEKERILSLARGEEDDDGDDPCIPTQDKSHFLLHTASHNDINTKEVLQQVIAQGPHYFSSLNVKLRPIIPFNNKAKLPRGIRQKVLDKLVGQHLALSNVLASLSTQSSIASAVEQEQSIYEKCSSSQVYQNIAARASALEWMPQVRSAADAERKYEELLLAERAIPEKTMKATTMTQTNKRKESSDDDGDDDACTETHKKKVVVLGLKESDLDWTQQPHQPSHSRTKLRNTILTTLESMPRWNKLTTEEKVLAVDRCLLKVQGRSQIEESAMRTLAQKYIDYLLLNRDK